MPDQNDIVDWSISGSRGEAILGNTHIPRKDPIGVIVIAHGFKGYKDYGMFPRIASTCAAVGLVAHRFNFSHSGMTNEIETFERPDLFERDTWNRQVEDLRAIVTGIDTGHLAGNTLPLILFGHSRGGVAVLLAVGRGALSVSVAGVVTAAAPAMCLSLNEDQQEELLRAGSLVSPSGRTGQDLRVGRAFLQEQINDPDDHDLLALCGNITCPALIIHGEDDPTVPAESARQIVEAIGSKDARDVRIPGGNHVFNTPNPFPESEAPSPQLRMLLDELSQFVDRVCTRSP